eukprot:gene22366-8885_t
MSAEAPPRKLRKVDTTEPVDGSCTGHSMPNVVKILLQAGADIEAKDQDGWTALLIACHNGHSDVVEMLLQAGADIEAKDQHGWTALMEACHYGHSNVVEMLLQAG